MSKAAPAKIFSRPVEIDRLPPGGLNDEIEASAEERAAIRELLDVVEVKACDVSFTVKPWRKEGFKVSGRVAASVVYTCVRSLEEFESSIEESFERFFLRKNAPGPRAEIVTVDPLEDEEPDVLSGNAIDVGVIALEILALAVDPYPRKPGVSFADPDQVHGDAGSDVSKTSPFSVLDRLKQSH